MAVAFDAKATAVTIQNLGGVASPISNSTLTVGGNGTLVIGVFLSAIATTAVPSAMTWNGVSMTPIGNIISSSNDANIYVYAIVNPAIGNHTCSCTYTANGATTVDLDCFSFSGTDTSSVANCIPASNILTDASTPSADYPSTAFSVTTISGDAVAAAANSRSGDPTNATIGTAINHDGSNSVNYESLYNLATTSITQGQFTMLVSSQPTCGIFFRILQPITNLLSAQIWI